MPALPGIIGEVANETGLRPEVAEQVQAMLAEAQAFNGTDAQRLAMFCASLDVLGNDLEGEEVTIGRNNDENVEVRRRRVDRVDFANGVLQRVYDQLGLIGSVELRVNQLNQELGDVAELLQELEDYRSEQVSELAAEIERLDADMQANAFDRMALASQRLTEAQQALAQSGISRAGGLHEMSIYTLQARSLGQRMVSLTTYWATLETFAAYGPELLGDDLQDAISARLDELGAEPNPALPPEQQSALAVVFGELTDLNATAELTAQQIYNDANIETPDGLIAAQQASLYGEIVGPLLGIDMGMSLDGSSFGFEGDTGDFDDFDDIEEEEGPDALETAPPDIKDD